MNLSSMTAADFKRILRHLERRDAILAELAEINAALGASAPAAVAAAAAAAGPRRRGRPPKAAKAAAASAPTPAPAKASPKAGRKAGKGGRSGKIKDSIIALVQAAGPKGITVKEVAAKVNRPAANIYVWFNLTGKKMKEIKKVGQAQYAWKGPLPKKSENPF